MIKVTSKYKKILIAIIIAIASLFVIAGVSFAANWATSNNTEVADSNAEPDINNFTKTTEWTNKDCTKGKVELTTEATGRGTAIPPKILFLGTLCNHHCLTADGVMKSINAMASQCDVDVYLYNRADYAAEKGDFIKSYKKGDKIKKNDADYKKFNGMIDTANHHALGKMIDRIYDDLYVSHKDYDFVVLETDGTLLADRYVEGDKLNPATTAAKTEGCATALQQYYNDGKVIWIHQNFYQESVWDADLKKRVIKDIPAMHELMPYYNGNKYYPNSNYYSSHTDQLNLDQFRSLMALINPDLYFDDTLSIYKDYHDITMPDNREALYGNPDEVVKTIESAVKEKYEYSLEFHDVIRHDQGLKITGAHFETLSDEEGAEWTVVPNNDPDVDISKNPTTGEVTGKFNRRGFHTHIKLVIEFDSTGASGTKDFKDIKQSMTGDPNKGTVDKYNSGKGQVRLEDQNGSKVPADGSFMETSVKVPLQWPVKATYEVDDGLANHDCGVSLASQDFMTNTAESKVQSSTAQPGNAWEFKGWYVKGDKNKNIISTNKTIKPDYDVDTNYNRGRYETGRYHDCGFVALFEFKGGLEKTGPTDASAGNQIKYTITVKNGASQDTDKLTVNDDISAYKNLFSTGECNEGGTYNVTTGKAVWNNVVVPAKGQKQLTITLTLKSDSSINIDSIKDTASVQFSANKTLSAEASTNLQVQINYLTNDTTLGTVNPANELLAPKTGVAQGSKPTAKEHCHFVNWTDAAGKEMSKDPNWKPTKTAAQTWVNGTTFTANFAIDQHTLKIHYVDEAGKHLAGTTDVSETFDYNTPYSYTSPTVEGYTLKNGSQSIIEGKLTADYEVNVVYVLNKHNLTIHYQDENGNKLADDHIENGKTYGSTYEVTSPTIAGYHLSDEAQTVIEGTMPDDDVEITVKYTENANVTLKYVSADTAMGTVEPASESLAPATGVAKGSTATPKPGYVFKEWKLGSQHVSDASSFTPTKESGSLWVDQTTYTAYFEFKPTIEKSAEKSVNAGERINYTIKVTNGTGVEIADASIVDPVPTDLTDIKVEDGGVYSKGVITWTKTIPVDGLELHFNALTPKNISVSKQIKNEASLIIDIKTIKSDTTTEVIPNETSFLINKVWSDGTVKHMDDTITINLYKNSVNDLVKSYTLDKNSTAKGVPWATETESFKVYDDQGQFINYFIRELDKYGKPVEDHHVFEYSGNKYTASYSYSYDTAGVMIGATATNTYNVVPRDLSIVKTGDKSIAKAGDTITYTIVVSNNATGGGAGNIVIEDPIPEGLLYVSASDAGTFDGSKVIWKIPLLKATESKTFTLVCKVPDTEREREYVNRASITNYSDEIPSEKFVTKQDITPPERHDVAVNIRKTILRYDDQGNEQDYLFTNEQIDGSAILRYYCFKYVADKLDEPVIEDTLPFGLEPLQKNSADYTLETSFDEVSKRYTVKMHLKDSLTQDRTDVDLPVKISSELKERTTMISDSMLFVKYTEPEVPEDLSARSNETEMLVDVEKHVDPIPVPKPVVTDVKEINVSKVWSDGEESHTNDSIEVSLLADGKPKDKQTLSAANKWSYNWKEMPLKTADGNIIKYTIEETKGKEGYTSKIVEGKDGYFEVHNDKIPEPAVVEQTSQTGDNNIFAFCIFAIVGLLSAFVLLRKKLN